MRIAIYGCGAMGTVIGAFLTRAGLSVDLVDTSEAVVDRVNRSGLELIGYENFVQPARALLPCQVEGRYDLVVLLTKQMDNREVFRAVEPHLNGDTTLLSLQNGYPEPLLCERFGAGRVVGGLTNWGADHVSPGVSRVTQPLARTLPLFDLGLPPGGSRDRLLGAAQVLERMGATDTNQDLSGIRWTNLLWNTGMSGMSAVLGVTFDAVLDSERAMRQVGRIGAEVGRVCAAAGCRFQKLPGFYLDFDRVVRRGDAETERVLIGLIRDTYADLRTARASMLQDLERGRRTEVDFLTGFICATGRRYGIPTPFNDTVVELIHAIEDGRHRIDFAENLNLFQP